MRNKLHATQNKHTRFCLKLNSKLHVEAKEIKQIKLLSTKETTEQRIARKVFKYWKETSPFCINEIFVPFRSTYNTRLHMALKIPLKKSNLGQKSISFIGPYF